MSLDPGDAEEPLLDIPEAGNPHNAIMTGGWLTGNKSEH